MTINPDINRYRDLMSLIPEGQFYDRDGIIVPYSDAPYEQRLTTDAPSTNFGVLLNSIFQGVVQSDALGNLVVSVKLHLGENTIEVVQEGTQERTHSYLTTRNYATWMAAYSDEFERIDDYIDEVKLGLNISTAFGADLEDIWGARVGQSNNVGYEIETYRNVVQELLLGYRLFGAKVRGHEIGAAAICQVAPLDYYRKFDGRRWVLASNFLENSCFEQRTHSATPTPTIAGITLKALSPLAAKGAASIVWNPATSAITYTDPSGSYTALVDKLKSGIYQTSGTATQATLVGTPAGPFFIPAGLNELRIEIDGRGMIAIPLPLLVTPLAAVVATINAALLADIRYGLPYSTCATAFGVHLALVSQQVGLAGSIVVYASPAAPLVLTAAAPLPMKAFGKQTPYLHLAVHAGPVGPFTIFPGVNDYLEFDIDGKGIFSVNAPFGAGVTAAMVAGTINAALVADPRYGAPYGGVAQGGSGCLELFSVASSITIYESNGAVDLLGVGTALKPTPFSVQSVEEHIATFDVTSSQLPLVTSTALFTVDAAPMPDNWLISAATWNVVPQIPIRTTRAHTALRVDAPAEVTLTKRVNAEANEYKGFEFYVTAWLRVLSNDVTAYVGRSFDGGVTWLEGGPIPVAPVASVYHDGTFILDAFILDPEATSFDVRIRLTSSVIVQAYIDNVEVRQPEITAAYLKRNTLPRSRHRSFFGHLIWTWCPDILTANESKAVGLGTPPAWPVGHIDSMGAVHTQLDKFNVTEVDVITGKAINLFGLMGEASWSSATLTNLEIVPGKPDRFTHVVPTVAGVHNESIVFSALAPHLATVLFVSDQVAENTMLFRDGVPVPRTYYAWINSTTIQLDSAMFSSGSLFSVRYRALYQVESAPIDLGPAWADYIWFSDYYGFFRYSARRTETETSTTLAFNFGSYQAPLDRPAVTDTTTCRLVRDDGVETFELPQDGWGFANAYTVSINGRYVSQGAMFTLFYQELGMVNERLVSVQFETRSGTSLANLAAAAYRPAQRNQAVRTHDGHRYQQTRVTLANIDDKRDVRLSSVVFKGLNLFGAQGTIPGLRP